MVLIRFHVGYLYQPFLISYSSLIHGDKRVQQGHVMLKVGYQADKILSPQSMVFASFTPVIQSKGDNNANDHHHQVDRSGLAN